MTRLITAMLALMLVMTPLSASASYTDQFTSGTFDGAYPAWTLYSRCRQIDVPSGEVTWDQTSGSTMQMRWYKWGDLSNLGNPVTSTTSGLYYLETDFIYNAKFGILARPYTSGSSFQGWIAWDGYEPCN